MSAWFLVIFISIVASMESRSSNQSNKPGWFCSVVPWFVRCNSKLPNESSDEANNDIIKCASQKFELILSDTITKCIIGNKIIEVDGFIVGDSSSIIYRVFDEDDNVLILKQYISKSVKARATYYTRELKLYRMLQSTGAVPELYASEIALFPSILIQYIQENLMQYMSYSFTWNHKMKPNDIAIISLQYLKNVGTVLSEMNRNRLMHTYITPKTILCQFHPDTILEFFVTDFMNTLSTLHGNYAYHGSINYLAPEQLICWFDVNYQVLDTTSIDRYNMV